MKYLFLTVLFPALFIISDNSVVIEHIINIQSDHIYADQFDNLYVSQQNNLFKYSSDGKLLSSYSNSNGENISRVDVKNNFKLILIFKQQNKIIFLDNTLSAISDELYLEEFEVYGNFSIINASTGGYWLFDENNSQLIKFDYDFRKEYKKDLFFDVSIKCLGAEDHNNLYFKTISDSILKYNINTNTYGQLPFQIHKSFNILNDNLQYLNKGKKELVFYKLSNYHLRTLNLPDTIQPIEAVKGRSKIFFNDESNVYISSEKDQ